MPKNLQALTRYKMLDACFRNKNKFRWSLSELRDHLTEQLQKENPAAGVSIRTIQEDIRIMRSDKLGFNAPIKVKNGDYFYSDRSYSIAMVFFPERNVKFILQLIGWIWKLSEADNIPYEKKMEAIRMVEGLAKILGTSVVRELEKSENFQVEVMQYSIPDNVVYFKQDSRNQAYSAEDLSEASFINESYLSRINKLSWDSIMQLISNSS